MTEPILPTAVRAINWAGRRLRGMGIPFMRLDESSLLKAASKKTGLSDFGDDSARQGLRVLLKSLEEETGLSLFGRIVARNGILELLLNRFEMVETHKLHPGIAKGEIHRPVFIIGMPRTGTSILHELIAQDPFVRTPLSWEVARSCPPPEKETYDTDPRIAARDKQLSRTDWLIPEFKTMHPMGALFPQECVAITAHDFASVYFQSFYHVPSYAAWLQDEADLSQAYASHRRHLQLLQWRCPAKRWVLKSPGHLWSLEELLAEYPDACLVQTHRDPIKILSSVTSLMTMLWTMTREQVDRREVAREWSSYLSVALQRSVEARESGVINPDQVMDIHFQDFMADTFGTIRKIYDRFDLEYTSEAESRMRRFLDENPSDKHGRHTYRFEDTGLDLAEEKKKVQHYVEYFNVESEENL